MPKPSSGQSSTTAILLTHTLHLSSMILREGIVTEPSGWAYRKGLRESAWRFALTILIRTTVEDLVINTYAKLHLCLYGIHRANNWNIVLSKNGWHRVLFEGSCIENLFFVAI